MAEGEWKIGILFSRTGVTAGAETSELNAALLAIEEINSSGGVLGRNLRAIDYDPGCSPPKFQEYAIRLLKEDKVRIVFGCYMSSERKVVLPQIEAFRGLLFYPTFYEGFEYSSRCFYGGAAANQNAVALAKYLIEKFGTRFLLVGSNYVFPREYNRVISELVELSGGQVVDEIYVPVEATARDFEKIIRSIKNHVPDVIVSTVVGLGSEQLFESFHSAGLDARKTPIASLTMTEAEVAKVLPEVVAGHLTSASFFENLDRPEARRFVAAFKERFGAGAPITSSAEAVYCQVHLFAKALALAGDDDPELIAKHLRGMEFEAPQGRIRIDPDNHHTELWSRIARINEAGQFEIVWQSENRIRPDVYFVTSSGDGWHAPEPQSNCNV
ncbi:transporter substrate-binding domain-containing protein [Hyphomicrobium sp.]|uniref:transporter substrate-binding domain-containing protein n=1 Tax=Hyphomicrobium sp. TaxID=82 RepID=UPI000FBBC0D3|nr:transporter substrate-binding domain-containing protein [Hyphomicrobium sp.]RUP10717.1 MAG: amino acid ABC transporter substrate-binding protein [Hyphomicrobium sp.]